MLNLNKKITAFILLIFVFQLIFPQYSSAHGLDIEQNEAKLSLIAMANLPQPVIFDPDNSSVSTLPAAESKQPKRKIKVTITAYSSTVDQCDADPFTTANGQTVRDGIVAANFLPFGTKIKIPGYSGDKLYSVEDRMNKRHAYRVDIWMPSREEAIKFGVQYLEIEVF